MKVTVSLSGMIASNCGFKKRTLEFDQNVTVKDILNSLDIKVKRNWLLVSVNDTIVKDFVKLNDGDDLRIIPICGGG